LSGQATRDHDREIKLRIPLKTKKSICVVRIIGGLVTLLIVLLVVRQAIFLSRAERVWATVMDYHIASSASSNNNLQYCPILEYTAQTGKTIRAESVCGSYQEYPLGAQVPMNYDPISGQLQPRNSTSQTIVGVGALVILSVFGYLIWRYL
jgi:hypothetical protein